MERNKQYPQIDGWRWPNFTSEEVDCKDGCGALPSEFLLDKLEALRAKARKVMPKAVLKINSCARCKKHDANVSNTPSVYDPHVRGLGVDISCSFELVDVLIQAAIALGVKGIGVSQKNDPTKRYLHFDWVDRGIKHIAWWSY